MIRLMQRLVVSFALIGAGGCGGAPESLEAADTADEGLTAAIGTGAIDAAPATTVSHTLTTGIDWTNVPVYHFYYPDLRFDGTMRSSKRSDGTLDVMIDVTNIGTGVTVSSNGRVELDQWYFAATAYEYYNASDPPPASGIRAGHKGYLSLHNVPAAVASLCPTYSVVIDVDKTMQYADTSVFGNDAGSVTGQCPLHWSDPISSTNLSIADTAYELQNKTLEFIVSSYESGRVDGMVCSNCHNRLSAAPIRYAPPVDPGQAYDFSSTQQIGAYSWKSGWATLFVATTNQHTPALRALVQKWLDDGLLP